MTIPESLLQEFAGFVEDLTGLRLPQRRCADLRRGMRTLAHELAGAGTERGESEELRLRRLMAMPRTPRLAGMVASHFTIGETYFFRDPAVFNALEFEVLPPLLAARRAGSKELRLWSAGCCTGEEVYSLAILLHRLIPDIAGWRITLLATDINPAFLAKARRGIYRNWSFRSLPQSIKRRYFHARSADSHAISPAIQHLVSFAYLNLADDTYPDAASNTTAMDIVLCRNVLMYFDPRRATQVIERLHGALADGGWLVVSPAETSARPFPAFSEVRFPGALFYRKEAEQPPLALQDNSQDRPETARMAPLPDCADGGAAIVPPAAPEETKPAAHPQALALLARSHADLGQLDDARHCCEAAIAADRTSPELRYLQAMILQEQGQLDAAMQSLRQALFLDQDFVLAHFALGSLCRRRGRTVEANRHFANAAALLGKHAPDETLPESAGITAAGLSAMIRSAGGLT
jgi:chemotaxis protein methyltransferase CheR